MAGSMSRQDEANPVFGLATKAHFSCLGFPVLVLQEKNFLFGQLINLFTAKLVFHGQDGWRLAFPCIVDIGLDFILVLQN